MTVVIREGHDHSGAVHKDHDHVVNKGITTQPTKLVEQRHITIGHVI